VIYEVVTTAVNGQVNIAFTHKPVIRWEHLAVYRISIFDINAGYAGKPALFPFLRWCWQKEVVARLQFSPIIIENKLILR
jgi:hypothetical protein